MSSLPEKSQPLAAVAAATTTSSTAASKAKPTSTTFFFRSDSIRKIKCTVLYPFQDAGIKLSKNIIIELLENNINKARICTQQTMLHFYCVILKLLSTLFTLWDNKVPVKAAAQTIPVDNASSRATKADGPNTSSTESYQTRLDGRINNIKKHKSRLNGDKEIVSASPAPITSTDTTSLAATTTNDLTCLAASKKSSASAENLRLFNSRYSNLLLNKSKCQELCLVLCVHAGLVIMYLQVVILGIALNTTKVPSGLIFLLATVGVIGYIFIKVSFVNKNAVPTRSPKTSPLPKAKNIQRQRDLIKDDFSPERQSRSKTKRLPISAIELQYKTLSKIKLL